MIAKLVICRKDGTRQDIEIKQGVTIVGRMPECEIRIPVSFVSRKHCRLVLKDEELAVQDLGSANGTYVNGQKTMETPLQAGDKLAIGPVRFTVQINGQPEKIPAPGEATALAADFIAENIDSDVDETLPPGLEFDDDDLLADFDPLEDARDDD